MEIKKIILCGRRCTGKTTLYWELQKKLNWPLFSVSEYLRGYLHRHNLKTTAEIDTKNEEMSNELNERIYNLLRSENKVILDIRVFAGIRESFPDTLKVLLIASEEARLRRAAYREGTDIQTQRSRLLKKENNWLKKMKQAYPFEFFDPEHYDLVIDTSVKTPQEVTSEVLKTLEDYNSRT